MESLGGFRRRCLDVFAEELGLIKTPSLIEFVLQCYDAICPESYWTRPASRTGKYHPDLARGDGGLVRHVKFGCFWADRLSRTLGNGKADSDPGSHSRYHDIAIAALLLHDVMKDGNPMLDTERGIIRAEDGSLADKVNGRWYREISGCHGVDMAKAIIANVLVDDPTREQFLVIMGVASHMGVWTRPDNFKPENLPDLEAREVARLVSTADYCSAQKFEAAIVSIMEKVPALGGNLGPIGTQPQTQSPITSAA